MYGLYQACLVHAQMCVLLKTKSLQYDAQLKMNRKCTVFLLPLIKTRFAMLQMSR